MKEQSKNMYYLNRFNQCKGDTAKTWNVINNLIRNKSKSSDIPQKLETNTSTVTETKHILNSLNTHFTSVGKLHSDHEIDYNHISSYLSVNQPNSIILNNTTAHEISKIISNLDSKKASGYDEISVTLLKLIKDIISPLLSELINESYSTGIYPNSLKIAKVIPIYKSGTKSTPGNYRPISLLSNINKIIEKTIYSRLIKYFNKYNLINDSQFGFRKGYNTTMAVTELYEKILDSNDKGNATCTILLDLSKAFDSVDHKIILHKLYNYGIRGNVWNLLQSYLTNRKQFVSGNNEFSDYSNVDVGVPQGSVLGPLLFLIHINDLKNSTDLKILNFADDTLLYYEFNDKNYAHRFVNQELDKVACWLRYNKLKINTSKTKYMIFAPNLNKYKNIAFRLDFGDSIEIDKVSEYKYLGLILDDKLSWKSHIKHLKSKLSRSLGILFKLRHLTNKNVLLTVFHSLFLSHLNYGILCWARSSRTIIGQGERARSSKTSLQPLIILLNKALRCINFCNYRDPVNNLLRNNNILQINELFKLELAKFMYSYNNGSLPNTFKDYFLKINLKHNYETRSSKNDFFIPRKNSSKGLCGLNYLGPRLWSEIPELIKNKKSTKSFTLSYKNLLLERYR